MGIIKEINELNPDVRNFLFSITFIMPFWYVCLFLFNQSLFFNVGLDLLIPLSFCFSIIWYLVSLVLSGIVDLITEKIIKFPTPNKSAELKIMGGIDSILYLCIAILIGYYSKNCYEEYNVHYRFTYFLKTALYLSIARAIFILIGALLIHKDPKSIEQQK